MPSTTGGDIAAAQAYVAELPVREVVQNLRHGTLPKALCPVRPAYAALGAETGKPAGSLAARQCLSRGDYRSHDLSRRNPQACCTAARQKVVTLREDRFACICCMR